MDVLQLLSTALVQTSAADLPRQEHPELHHLFGPDGEQKIFDMMMIFEDICMYTTNYLLFNFKYLYLLIKKIQFLQSSISFTTAC